MSMAELADAVKLRILEAFETTPYPGDGGLVTDQSGYDPESSEIANAFKGKDWRDVSVEMLRSYAEALPLFTPAAFRYYLPAYMIGCVDSRYAVDVALDSVLFNLTPPKDRSGWEWDFFWTRAQRFSKREREAIRSFLELMEQYKLSDWEGREPPENRVRPALDFWVELTTRW
jgi:hypothetical protein